MTFEDLAGVLSRTSAFGALSPTLREPVASRMRVQHLAPGETLAHAGENGKDLYVVLEGQIEIRRSSSKGFASDRSYTAGPHAVIGEVAVFAGHPRTASMMALSAASLAVLSDEDFNLLCEEFPAQLALTLQWMQKRLLAYQLRECIEDSAFWGALDNEAKDELASLFQVALISVDVSLELNFPVGKQFDLDPSGWKVLRHKVGEKVRRRQAITIAGILSRMVRFGGAAHMKQIQAMADIPLTPPLAGFTGRDFARGEEIARVANEYTPRETTRWMERHGRSWERTFAVKP
jgi:CRP-like cAMP-binding protein